VTPEILEAAAAVDWSPGQGCQVARQGHRLRAVQPEFGEILRHGFRRPAAQVVDAPVQAVYGVGKSRDRGSGRGWPLSRTGPPSGTPNPAMKEWRPIGTTVKPQT
jgi:hypothetical protein